MIFGRMRAIFCPENLFISHLLKAQWVSFTPRGFGCAELADLSTGTLIEIAF